MDNINPTDMIYNKSGGTTMAGGFSINSRLLNDGLPAVYNGENIDTNKIDTNKIDTNKIDTNKIDTNKREYVKFSERFKHLAIPAGLLYINDSFNKSSNKSINKSSDIDNNSEVINDDLYEKLLALAQDDNSSTTTPSTPSHKKHTTKKNKTKSHKKNKNKKTRRK